ncbi:MAG TPA: bifunctional UDP-N-acetylglucosamine diphosphorylase/glucosamine-1-phosphate N-acetyltransferase GlmU [Polyangiaceae bacterium]|jgi:bifunctional UDP-N-acetylglucosamine pyrophosphorylase / glucosamine-1-phosphate N-acetyltransferase|nr:bifunctional UDP-N-acetylglucosamine diphosphorylase/glucosamine-1-phosphate N-acetyltransferase GlmU [Polyangiaceae bacterium]
MTPTAIILAAGQGTRMKSDRPKVLHTLAGKAMLDYVVEAALAAGCRDAVVVVGSGREAVIAHLARFGPKVKTAVQAEQLGTGHAVRCALPAVDPSAQAALILYGDTPLVRHEDLALLIALGEAPLAMLTCHVDDATGYGRIVRNDAGRIQAVREHVDCSDDERRIREINPGMYHARLDFLRRAVDALVPDNEQGELYLTDIVALAAKEGIADRSAAAETLAGINDRAQLAAAEDMLHARIADRWRRAGVTIRASAHIDADVQLEADAVIEHGAVLRGATRIGGGARIDVGCVLDDVTVAPGAYLKPYTVALSSTIGERAQVGPFAHLRPDSVLDEDAHVGNFVETKKTHLHRGAKANHLAYLGDGDIGEGANVGAGTIFCNYDGFRKHRTVIGARAFIGSDSQLVAPITIGEGAYVATGTTVTKDVPADALAVGRARQENKAGYASRLRSRLASRQGK